MKQEAPASPTSGYPPFQRPLEAPLREPFEDSFRDGLSSSGKKLIKRESRSQASRSSSVRYRSLLGQRLSNRLHSNDRSIENSEEYSLLRTRDGRTGQSWQESFGEPTRASLESEPPTAKLLTSLKQRLESKRSQRTNTRTSHQPYSSSGMKRAESRESYICSKSI
jgi:hypothetical protein